MPRSEYARESGQIRIPEAVRENNLQLTGHEFNLWC